MAPVYTVEHEEREEDAWTGLLFAVMAVLLVCAAVFGWSQAMKMRPSVPDETSAVVSYTVSQGDTLWKYAERATPEGGDVTQTVSELMHINQLDSPSLEPGQRLLVPSMG